MPEWRGSRYSGASERNVCVRLEDGVPLRCKRPSIAQDPRTQEAPRAPPPAGSHAGCILVVKKKVGRRGGGREILCPMGRTYVHQASWGVGARSASERRAAARSAQATAQRRGERPCARAVRYCSGAEPRFAAPASHQRLDESQVMSSDMSQVKVRPTEGLLILA